MLRESQVDIQSRTDELLNFIAENDRVRIRRDLVSVPSDLRPAFYSKLDALLEELVDKQCRDLLPEAQALGSRYQETASSLITKSNLQQIDLPHTLAAYLDNPKKAIATSMYPLVFDFLQGHLDRDGLVHTAHKSMQQHAETLFRCGYEFWVFFCMLNLLRPQGFFSVDFGADLEPVIQDSIVFEPGRQSPFPERRIPDTVVATGEGEYYALKFESVSEIAYYDVPITRRRDNTLGGHSQQIIGQRAMLVYRIASAEDIPTIANRDERAVSPPDIVIEVNTELDLAIPASRLALGNRALTLKPKHAYYVFTPCKMTVESCFSHELEMVAAPPVLEFVTMQNEVDSLKKIAEIL